MKNINIFVENTPNPSTKKFVITDFVIAENEPIDFVKNSLLNNFSSDLVDSLFKAHDGITGVFFGYDFISVTKESNIDDWENIIRLAENLIKKHLQKYNKISYTKKIQSTKNVDASDFSKIETEIIELLNTKVRPYVAKDGGDIIFSKFDDGTVYLKLKGACSGCPQAGATLKMGIENLLKYYIPEIKKVEQVL